MIDIIMQIQIWCAWD